MYLGPLSGACMNKTITYEDIVDSTTGKDTGSSKKLVGLTKRNIKTRFNNHALNFSQWNGRRTTRLSNYACSLKEQGTNYKVRWKHWLNVNLIPAAVVSRVFLIWKDGLAEKVLWNHTTCLTSITECFGSCPHVTKYLLLV